MFKRNPKTDKEKIEVIDEKIKFFTEREISFQLLTQIYFESKTCMVELSELNTKDGDVNRMWTYEISTEILFSRGVD